MQREAMRRLLEAEEGSGRVLQGNLAFAVGCARGGIHAADGYPGTPSTEVIDRGLRHLQDRMTVGWSVNEANALLIGFGQTMVGADAVVTMKIPGLFQAADAVATTAGYTARRGGLVLFVASDFVPSSTQYLFDPRYFLKSCFIPVLEPRTHQEMLESGPLAARIAREHGTMLAILANGFLCHSEGMVRLNKLTEVPALQENRDFGRFMNLPPIARKNYDAIVSGRMSALRALAEESPLNRIEWNDRSLGVVVHGVTELYLREAWADLPVKPSVLSLGITFPLPPRKVAGFVDSIAGPVIVLDDGFRFVQEEISSLGLRVEGKKVDDATTEWSPETVARRLGVRARKVSVPVRPAPPAVPRPPALCPGCCYRAFGLAVQKLKKRKKIVASFGDIGCNTLLHFLGAADTCACMGASDTKRQGVVLADRSLAGRVISVIGDSTECHSGLDSTRNALFRKIPGVKVILDNRTTAMTGCQPAPTTGRNLAGERVDFDLIAALRGEGAGVEVVDAFDLAGIEAALKSSLARAEQGEFTVLVVRGECIQTLPEPDRRPRLKVLPGECTRCEQCLICPGLEPGADGFPAFTTLCSGCGGQSAVCVQRCHQGAIVPLDGSAASVSPPPPPLPEETETGPDRALPVAIRIALRGVGGQGSLFLGKVLARVAMLAGYQNIIKGETHGMAQRGGAVLSTFSCGEVHSPVLSPGSADVIVALEESEVLRQGFIDCLKPGGTVLLNRVRILPPGVEEDAYPTHQSIVDSLEGYRVIDLDSLALCRAMGDELGRTANVVVLGVLSTLSPLDALHAAAWRGAILEVSSSESISRANLAAFAMGRGSRP